MSGANVVPTHGATKPRRTAVAAERRLAWLLVLPALGTILLIAIGPLAGTLWESLHRHDLRTPWLGREFVGLANYAEAFADARLWQALAHTASFTAITVALEMTLGLALAIGLDRAARARGPLRTATLLPWAIPTVVAALIWRFMFDARAGIVGALLVGAGVVDTAPVWFTKPLAAWVPLILADVWKATPFTALLLLAGLQSIDPALDDAARIDGASGWRRFTTITLPLLLPAIAVALIFRTLDAFRVFDLVYVMTGGGPGTATEPISLYAFNVTLGDLRFGYGSTIAMIVFLATAAIACVLIASGRSWVDSTMRRGE